MEDGRGRGGHLCPVCGGVYAGAEEADRCAAFAPAPVRLEPGTLVAARGAAGATGPGLVRGSFLLGLGDERGEPHARFYRVAFIWGRADLPAEALEDRGPATEAEWRAAVEAHDPTS